MGLLIILVVLALLVWVDVLTIRSMYARRAGILWWASLGLLLLAGGIGGVWGMLGEYQLNDRWRVFGFPFPVGGFHLEGDDWIDYVSPYALLIAPLNLMTCLVLAPLPVAVVYAAWRLKAKLLPSNH